MRAFARYEQGHHCATEGRVGGGGSELAASMDMRFGVIDKTVINQMEVPWAFYPAVLALNACPGW